MKTALLRARFPLRGEAVRLGARAYDYAVGVRARLRGGDDPERGPDGLPLPPASLRARVSAPGDAGFFLEAGRSQADFVRELVARNGSRMEDMGAILDFGCGCGRLARWWSGLGGPAIHGCDTKPDLVEWCSRNLPFMSARVNGLEPPLPYETEHFDLIYALSVFTHMSEELQDRWLNELDRVLRPGGLLFFTVAGDAYTGKLEPADRARYETGELVAHFTEADGSNLCAAYHPRPYVEAHMLERLELLEAVPGGGGNGSAPPVSRQDIYLARKPARPG